jgi:hypothetical protein
VNEVRIIEVGVVLAAEEEAEVAVGGLYEARDV